MVRKILFDKDFGTFTLELLFRSGSWWIGVHKSDMKYITFPLSVEMVRTYCINIIPCITLKYSIIRKVARYHDTSNS